MYFTHLVPSAALTVSSHQISPASCSLHFIHSDLARDCFLHNLCSTYSQLCLGFSWFRPCYCYQNISCHHDCCLFSDRVHQQQQPLVHYNCRQQFFYSTGSEGRRVDLKTHFEIRLYAVILDTEILRESVSSRSWGSNPPCLWAAGFKLQDEQLAQVRSGMSARYDC